DGIRDFHVTGVQTCALPICPRARCRTSSPQDRVRRGVRQPQRLRVRASIPGGKVSLMSENPTTPSERPYGPATDPDADPEQLEQIGRAACRVGRETYGAALA